MRFYIAKLGLAYAIELSLLLPLGLAATSDTLAATVAEPSADAAAADAAATKGASADNAAQMKGIVTPVGSAATNKQAARGRYVAIAGDCVGCHATPEGKPFAGGNALKSAFGTIYGPNITPDKETGIGTWTKADFEKALRLGIAKGGTYLYPAMPYDAYTKLTAADMDALWVYMQSVPAVKNTIPKNTLPFPLSVRSGLAVWQSLYFKPGPFEANLSKDATWNRGSYLVNALGHCADCHTPRNTAQGLESEHQLAGATISGWYAPDISNDPLSKIASWKTEQLAHFLKSGKAPGNANSFGPMAEVVHDSLSRMTDSDLHAMAVYLKDQSVHVESVTASAVKMPPERLKIGAALFTEKCGTCHQANGKGVSASVPSLAGNDAVNASEPYNVIMAMLEGFPPQGTWGAMGSFANTLNDDQISDITNYVRTAWGNNAAPNSTPWLVGNWRKNIEAQQSQPKELLCPSIGEDVMNPAFSPGPDVLKQAANDRGKMAALVGQYKAARPNASTSQVIQALSTSYCRAIAPDNISEARMSAQLANYAQRIAVASTAAKKPAT